MNVNSAVSMGILMQNFTSSVRKDIKQVTNTATNFGSKLDTFRRDNALVRLNNSTTDGRKSNVNETEAIDWDSVPCSSQLFSAWDSNLSAEQALKKLDDNLSMIGSYSLDSSLESHEVLDHIAAQYTVYKRHISATGSKEDLGLLDKLIERHTTQYAKGFSEVVGGFYEDNGMSGERNRIYDSIMDSVKSKITMFETFISKKPDLYESLQQDSQVNQKSLSNELRTLVRDFEKERNSRGVREVVAWETKKIENYFAVELSRAAKLAKISVKMQKDFSTAKITNEKEIGLMLGKNSVQALTHIFNLDKMSGHEQAFLTSYQNHANRYLDDVDGLLQIEADRYKENNPNSKKEPFKPIDRDAVFAVVQAMENEYKDTFSVAAAVKKGKSLGLEQYMEKADPANETERYRSSSFWNQTMKEMLNPKNKGTLEYRNALDILKREIESLLNATA